MYVSLGLRVRFMFGSCTIRSNTYEAAVSFHLYRYHQPNSVALTAIQAEACKYEGTALVRSCATKPLTFPVSRAFQFLGCHSKSILTSKRRGATGTCIGTAREHPSSLVIRIRDPVYFYRTPRPSLPGCSKVPSVAETGSPLGA